MPTTQPTDATPAPRLELVEAPSKPPITESPPPSPKPATVKHLDPVEALRAGKVLDHRDGKVLKVPMKESNAQPKDAPSDSAPWDEPMPLTAADKKSSFPLETLPEWLREWTEAVAWSIQVAPDMPALLGLAMVSVACARRFIVHVRADFYTPVNIYVCVAAPVSERKSPVFAAARAPIDVFEREQRELAEMEAGHIEDAIKIAKAKLDKAIRTASGDKPSTTSPDASKIALANNQDVREARAELEAAETKLRASPRMTVADITQEQLAQVMHDQGGRIALLDPEGIGPISIMLGRYSKGQAPNIDIFLKAYSAELLSVDRVKQSDGPQRSFTVPRPALTTMLTIQPSVFDHLAKHEGIRGLGLLARFVWCVPESLVGRRRVDTPGVPAPIREAYEANVRELLALEPAPDDEPHTLGLSDDARRVHQAFDKEIEPQLGPGGKLAHVGDWAGKLAGLVARIAALLHCAEHRQRPWEHAIDEDTMQRAITLGRWALGHAEYVLERISTSGGPAELAKRILDHLHANQDRTTIDKRTLQRELRPRLKKADELDEPLKLLCDLGWLRAQTQTVSGPIKRDKPAWLVHPTALKGQPSWR